MLVNQVFGSGALVCGEIILTLLFTWKPFLRTQPSNVFIGGSPF